MEIPLNSPCDTDSHDRYLGVTVFRSQPIGGLFSLDSAGRVCSHNFEVKTDPYIQVAEPTVEVVEEMERNTGGSEVKSTLPKEEAIQLSIQDGYGEEGNSRKGQHLKPERSEQQEDTGHPHQCNAKPLPPFEVQVIW